jgi:hypothetical protein
MARSRSGEEYAMSEGLAGVPAGCPGRPAGTAARRCPRCWSERLRLVETAGAVNLLCTSCHRCWSLEAGYLIEVNPYACSGCADRDLCRAR